jgi:catecholate siderophore receptor
MFQHASRSLRFGLCALLLITFGLIQTGFANEAQSLYRGRVLDPNHAVVPGAKVTAVPTNGSATVTAVTDQNGNFSMILGPSDYTLTVSAPGFAEATRTINAGRTGGVEEYLLAVSGGAAIVNVVAPDNYQTDSISSATKTLTPLINTPQSITVVSKDQIRDQSFRSIAEVANYIPGVTAHQGENNRDQLIMRGNSTSADFFLNGVRDDVQYYRDLYNVDRFEVLKGPSAMAFGRGGGGGVINRVSKEAGFLASREFFIQGGSYGNKRVMADLNQPFNSQVAGRLNAMFEDSGSFRDGVGLRRYGFNPTLTYTPSTNTKFTLGYEFFHDRRNADRGIPSYQLRPVGVDISTYFGDPKQTFVRADVHLLTGSVEHTIGKLNIRNRTQYGNYDRMYQNFVPGAVNTTGPTAGTLAALTAYNNATKRKNIFNQTDLTYIAYTGEIRHTLLAGMEFGRQLTDNFRNTGFFNNTATSIQVPLSNPRITTPVTWRQNATDANNHLKTNLASGYVQDQMELTSYLQIVAGLRFDYFDLTYHNNRNNDTLRRIDRLWSPRVGLIVKPRQDVSLYANYSVSFLPSSGDQFSSLTTITQQVKPEQFSNYEVGVKWDIRRYLSFTSALFRQDRTNTRSTDPFDPTRIVQTGSQRSNGFESSLTGRITDKWRVVGGYGYLDAFISAATTASPAGAKVAQTPHHTFSLWNNYQIVSRLSAGLGIVHRSNQFAAIDNSTVLPGYTRADAAVFVTINEHWRVQGNIENLFNKKYYVNADNNNNISPGTPISARVALVARF